MQSDSNIEEVTLPAEQIDYYKLLTQNNKLLRNIAKYRREHEYLRTVFKEKQVNSIAPVIYYNR